MSNISIIEKMVKAYQNNETVPLKGHTRLTLCDAVTGKVQEQVESDNMVTNAVSSILARNYCGLANFSSLLPLRSLYSGVLLFSNTITENANNYFPPADSSTQSMTAHAGPTPHATASPYRGNPNGGETIIGTTSIKQVWDWSTNQGNGTISSVCLCGGTLGDMGLKPFDETLNPLSTFGGDTLTGVDMSETEVSKYAYAINSDGKTSLSVYLDGTSFKEFTVNHDYFSFGIMRSGSDWNTVSSREATVRAGSSSGSRIVFDDTNYYYIVQATYNNQTSKYGLLIDKVAKSNFAVTTGDIEYDGITLYTGTIYEGDMKGDQQLFAFDGTYLYYPNSAGTSFVKVNITNSSDVFDITGTIDIGKGRAPSSSNGRQFTTPLVINQGLILGSNYIINGLNAYPIYHARQLGCSDGNYGTNRVILIQDGASVYGKTRYVQGSVWRTYQLNILNQMFLSTINNLENSVSKSTSQTMKVEYTISEI